MDTAEARRLLTAELARYRDRSHDELVPLLGRIEAFERRAPSGQSYQLEIQAFWEDGPGGPIRVLGAISTDTGWRSIAPLNETFLRAPDGSSSR